MLNRFKSMLRLLHLVLGLTTGLVVFVVAITAAVSVFDDEFRDAFQAHLLYVPLQNAPTILPQQAMNAVATAFPKERVEQIRFRTLLPSASVDNKRVPVVSVHVESDRIFSVHPYTAQILGVRDMTTDVFALAVRIHTTLLLGDLGEEIIRWNVAIFAVMILSGIVLWLPRHLRFIRDAIRIKPRAAAVRRLYDLHSVAGFYAFFVLLIVAWSGIFWMFDSVEDGVYAAFGQKPLYQIKPKTIHAATKNDVLPLDAAYNASLAYGTPTLLNLQLPKKPTDALRAVVRYPYRFVRKQNVLYFDNATGALLKADLYAAYTTPDKIRVSNFDLHTGRFFGLSGKILWFIAALFAASLPVTGTILWWKKLRRKQYTELDSSKPARLVPRRIPA
jgi:uncharacterized iron-regulated membrane protein